MGKELIYESAASRIFTQFDEVLGKRVVHKEQKQLGRSIQKLINQFELLRNLDVPGVPRVLACNHTALEPTLVLEYAEGRSLREHLSSGPLSLADFFAVAHPVCAALAALHQAGILHRDVNPNNIIWDQATGAVTLIDFDCATSVRQRNRQRSDPGFMEGTLAYMSPEQTGRINRDEDFRSDLYSLGATFFEMLCGQPPFPTADPHNMVYAHIARIPPDPATLRPDLPLVLSQIVLKLLEKESDRRYQSARGLLYDLHRIAEVSGSGASAPAAIELGSRDYSESLQLSQKLYGREREITQLKEVLKAVRAGSRSLVLIEGSSGTGKSALVQEMSKTFLDCNCISISGKFDQFRRDTPYLAWTQAFEKLVQYALSRDEAELKRWQQQIGEALGGNARVLTELVPSLEKLIGVQAPAEPLAGVEAQTRFRFVVQRFVGAICRAEHPLVIFLDDYQWADLASRQLLQSIIGSTEIEHLMVILAFRPLEEEPGSALKRGLKDPSGTVEPVHMRLEGLREKEIAQWLSDSIRPCDPQLPGELAALIYAKTLGNAFFSKGFIQALYDEGLLFFDADRSVWEIKKDAIRRLQMTDNVVDFLTEKIRALDPETVDVLRIASIIGNVFSSDLLGHLMEDGSRVQSLLQAPLKEGFIEMVAPESGRQTYAFVHDRIYQAVAEMNPPEFARTIHLRIARYLLRELPQTSWYDVAFELAGHLNHARQHLTEGAEQDAFLQVNLLAGKRAKASNAYDLSVGFLENGLSAAQARADLEFQFLLELIESYYLEGHFEKSEAAIARARAIAADKDALLDVLRLEIRFKKAKSDYQGAIRTGIDALRLVGVRLPYNPGVPAILQTFMATRFLFWRKGPEDLLDLPPNRDSRKLVAVQILSELGYPAYMCNQNLLPIMTMKAVQLSVQYGNSQYSAADYNVYGFLLGQMGDLDGLRRFSRMSRTLQDQMDTSLSMTAKHTITYHALTRHWYEHPAEGVSAFAYSHQLGRESGDLDAMFTSLVLQFDHAVLTGQPMEVLSEIALEGSRLSHGSNQTQYIFGFDVAADFLKALRDPEHPFDFIFEEKEEVFLRNSDAAALCKFAVLQAYLLYLHGRHREGLEMLDRLKKHPMAIGGLLYSAWLPTLEGLLAGGMAEAAPAAARKRVKKALKTVGKWAAFCPANFEHRRLCLEAQLLMWKGKVYKAARQFMEAAQMAAQNHYPLDQALFAWKAAQAYQQVGEEDRATPLALSAFQLFEHIGHHTGARAIREAFPIQSAAPMQMPERDGVSATMRSTGSSSLDLAMVIRTMNTLSREVDFSKLVRNLLAIVAENAGAEKGFLILDKKAEWLAANDPADAALGLLSLETLSANKDLVALQVVNYCLRTGEPVVLDAAWQSEQFASDPVIAGKKLRSLLCIPLKNQGATTGLLYLENNLMDGAFTGGRSELLSLLSSQLAVSLENTYLYEHLEQMIRERTQQLELEKQKSDKLLLNILPAEVASELKEKGSAEPTQFDMVTVLFTDFVNFTGISERLSPKELVSKLDFCFKAFDLIAARHGLEKIKTVGDAYIAVCGLPLPDPDHGKKTVLAALEMRDFIQKFKTSDDDFAIRIGIHSGPVVAGIVGSKKFQYDIWGDTVNLAARMEQSAEPGQVNISRTTHALISGDFQCTYRGKMPAKNKGLVDMYYVESAL